MNAAADERSLGAEAHPGLGTHTQVLTVDQLRISEFIYVDTAFGGVNRRNNVKRLDDVRLNGLADCYVSHNRATEALLKWRNTHKNENGNPTVAGFDGPTWADNLHLDYDNEADPGQALVWLRQGLDWFEAHDVDLRALRIYFSGYKGFGVEVPHTLFGGFAPAVDFHTPALASGEAHPRRHPVRYVGLRQDPTVAPAEQPPQQERPVQDQADGRRGTDAHH